MFILKCQIKQYVKEKWINEMTEKAIIILAVTDK